MTTTKPVAHTPGPWTMTLDGTVVRGAFNDVLVFGPDRNQSIASAMPYENAEANARLIAAAPTMLAVLWEALGALLDLGDPNYDGGRLTNRIKEAIREAEARND